MCIYRISAHQVCPQSRCRLSLPGHPSSPQISPSSCMLRIGQCIAISIYVLTDNYRYVHILPYNLYIYAHIFYMRKYMCIYRIVCKYL